MKRIFYSGLFLLFGATAFAQYNVIPYNLIGQNPRGVYTGVEQTSGVLTPEGWTSIQATSATPVWSPNQNMPFAFSFNGSAVTSYKVSTSGVLTFDVNTALAAPSHTFASLPDASIPDNSVCVWGLNALGANDAILKRTMGTAPYRQHIIMFSSMGYGNLSAGGWTYWMIVMEETTNRISIVDARTYNFTPAEVAMGLQINSTTAIVYNGTSTYASQATNGGNEDTPVDNSYFTFSPGAAHAVDVEAMKINLPNFVPQGNTNVTGTLRNNGTAPITSMTLNYKIGTAATVSQSLTGLNIASYSNYNFTHGTPWNATPGTFNVKVWASNINGQADGHPHDDTLTKSVSVLGQLVQRVPFYEIFTSSTCGPCTPGNINFMNITDTISRNNYVAVKYQQDFPGTGDPYRTVESVNRRNTPYAINSIPRMEIDGGWDGNASSFVYSQHTQSRQNPALYVLNGEFQRLPNQQFSLKVRYSPLVDVTGEKLYVALIEKTTVNNVKTNGETIFHDVMKKMLPNETGTTLPNVAVGAMDSISMTYTFQGNYRLPASGAAANIINHNIEHSVENFSNIEVVAWVQMPDKSVLQAARLTNTTNSASLTESMKMQEVRIAPNPSNESFAVNFEANGSEAFTFVLVDVMGNVVFNSEFNASSGVNSVNIPTAKLATGMYHLMMFDDQNNAHVEKVMVQH